MLCIYNWTVIADALDSAAGLIVSQLGDFCADSSVSGPRGLEDLSPLDKSSASVDFSLHSRCVMMQPKQGPKIKRAVIKKLSVMRQTAGCLRVL